MFKKILVATDGSDSAEKAADQAVQLAKSLGASIVVMTAEAPSPAYLFPPDVLGHMEQALERQSRQILAAIWARPAITRGLVPGVRPGEATGMAGGAGGSLNRSEACARVAPGSAAPIRA
jgi:hypothetical protein